LAHIERIITVKKGRKMNLNKKVAIVTGASRGLGKTIAIGLAKAGARVVVAARTEIETPKLSGTIHETVLEIRMAGGEAEAVKCDVTNEDQVAEMVTGVIDHFGPVHILVNNAGIAYPAAIWELPLKRWELALKVNLTGAFLCAKAVLPGMMSMRTGSIINISSIQAQQKGSVKSGTVYGVSKAALERLTHGMAAELRSYNIAVNCLKPRGAVRTEGMNYLYPDVDQSGWDSPDMMVKAAVFLAAQDGTGMTGIVATDEEICSQYMPA
jgi:citronellol/citronellal dehydrogenase